MSDSKIRYPLWQIPYRDAITELDRNTLAAKILTAEKAIRERLQAIERDARNADERDALSDALSNLNVLKR